MIIIPTAILARYLVKKYLRKKFSRKKHYLKLKSLMRYAKRKNINLRTTRNR